MHTCERDQCALNWITNRIDVITHPSNLHVMYINSLTNLSSCLILQYRQTLTATTTNNTMVTSVEHVIMSCGFDALLDLVSIMIPEHMTDKILHSTSHISLIPLMCYYGKLSVMSVITSESSP